MAALHVAADELDFYRYVWPVTSMIDGPHSYPIDRAYPKDRETLDREYSPSLLVDSMGDYLAAYGQRSAAARKQLSGRLKIGMKYGPDVRHRLDYFATDHAGGPLVIFFHGGFWSALDESSFSFPAPTFLDAGVNYASVTYRLAPYASLTDIVSDAHLALAWLRAQAPEFGFDPAQIVVAGHSAGAHLASMLMIGEDALKGALLVSGVYDLEPVRQSYVNDTVSMDETEAHANSPAFLLPSASIGTHIAVGAIETNEFKRQSHLLYDSWSQRLPACSINEYPGRDHFDILFDLSDPTSTIFGETLNLLKGSAQK